MSLTSLAMFVYTVLLKPRPLRWLTDNILLALIPKQVRLPEGMLTLHPNDPVISGALALGVYETYQLSLFREMVTEGMTVLDIGANVGLYTVIAAGRVGKEGRIFAFEPELQNFGILAKNISENNFTNAEAVHVAVADKEGALTLHLARGNKGQHSLLALPDEASEQDVRTIALDDWLHTKGVEQVDVIKIDIQGAESLAFMGMQKTLAQKPAMLMEYEPKFIRDSGHEPIAMLEMLLAHGYTLYSIEEGSKAKKLITDIHAFTDSFSGDQYANLYCV